MRGKVLFVGTAVYNGTVRLPFLSYATDYTALNDPPTPGMRVPASLASPALMKSPLLRRLSCEYESPAGVLTLAARAAALRRDAEAVSRDVEGAEGGQVGGRPRASSSERNSLVGGAKGGGGVKYGYTGATGTK